MPSSVPELLLLNPSDSVAVATREIPAGSPVSVGGFTGTTAATIPSGHKIAIRAVAPGEPVVKYGQVIGTATQPIEPGQHVHVHNLGMGEARLDHGSTRIVEADRGGEQATFLGIRRPSGQVATRNYIGVIASVNCSATVCKRIADAFNGNALADYPNVDGVVAIVHGSGCGMNGTGEGMAILRRTLRGYADHANFAGLLLIGLGCEMNQIAPLAQTLAPRPEGLIATLTIQEEGGTRETIDRGVALVRAMLPIANDIRREPVPASHLTVGLQCGGSDGYSGITANPVLGAAVDLLVAHGGTAILSETPEIYGAEHLLTARAASPAVAEKLMDRIRWWEDYTRMHKGDMNNNPSPGNKAGGITTILEKSLGAVAKGGGTRLNAVVDYAEPVTDHGLVFMDTPGYDPVSATGQVAGGANLIAFTTGRGSTYGCKPTPSLKIATNSALYARMGDDMDFNGGAVLDGGTSVAEAGAALFRLMLDTASGHRSRSEENGIGDNEFVPWQIGAVM
ncbi:altronate hydrolase [Azospirillum lipoferum]|uniref:Altronate dehydratase n=1 Tax=Azospirillum lipoferum TaxID=193 RepID=A0A5A9GMX3_AZOLI|nr:MULTISPECIES: altronate dehydratase family protein [Azospirillum]KAA0595165.1 altronate dehydratase [Azospirillum lipoferum]MCP1611968.1 altronate hydrolase [Azospirillum lipoferum]MDW5533273.1 altronate dehydratase family protein [Azospirillum sp. NL1]